MASNTSSLGTRKDRWTSSEVFTLLATLNSSIENIRIEYRTDKREGASFAANLLSEAIGNGCSPERATSKLKWIWINARCDEADNRPDPLYILGAWTRTLPDLNRLYPEMLELLAKAGKTEQCSKFKPDHNHTRPYSLRRKREDEDNDPYDCRCGYFHWASSSVHCSICYTWQHVWCYYGTDDERKAPSNHTCDKCVVHEDSAFDSDLVLQQAMADLEIGPGLVYTRHGSSDTSNKRSAIFETPPDEEFYGISAKELHLKARSITSAIDVIAHSLNSDKFALCKLSAKNLDGQSDMYDIFGVLGLDAEDKSIFSPTEQTNLVKSVLAASIWQWTCYPSKRTDAVSSPSNQQEALLYARTQISLEQREQKVLRRMHHKAWNYLAMDKPEILQPIITRESDELTRRLFLMLSVLLEYKKSTEGNVFLRSVDDWVHGTVFGVSRFKHIKHLFDRCIKFRNLFAMSEYHYELHYPTFADIRFMDLNQEDVGKKVQFCFTPAILEFEPNHSQRAEWGVSAIFGNQRFISATPEKRHESRLACPAVVQFRQ